MGTLHSSGRQATLFHHLPKSPGARAAPRRRWAMNAAALDINNINRRDTEKIEMLEQA
jgi:hypothetical protein